MKKLFYFTTFLLTGTSVLYAQHDYDNQSVIYSNNGKVGIGVTIPEGKFHVQNGNIGIKSQHAVGILESNDVHLDLISSSDATWGSSINLIEGNGASNTDIWSIARQTTNGSGNSSLRFNFGNSNNHLNTNIVTFNPNGHVGIGTTSPEVKFHVQNGNIGIKSQHAVGILESNDVHLDLISSSDATWGSSINLIEGNGASNTDIWSIARQTTNGSGNSSLRFNFGNSNNHLNTNIVTFNPNGHVGIGTTEPDAKLTVKGDIHAQEIKLDLNGTVAPDFVFEPSYNLRTLAETEQYIKANKHLPEIPSAAEMGENGIELKAMNMKLLQKIEELTLYTIQQQKLIEKLIKRIETIENQ